LEVVEGENTNISCFSSRPVKWCFNGKSLPRNAREFFGNYLMISLTSKGNQGYYICEGYDHNGIQFHAKATISVICM